MVTLTHFFQGENLGLWGCEEVKRILVFWSIFPDICYRSFLSQIKTQLSVMGNTAVRMVTSREKCASLENTIFLIVFPSYTSFNTLFGFARARAGCYGVCVPARQCTHPVLSNYMNSPCSSTAITAMHHGTPARQVLMSEWFKLKYLSLSFLAANQNVSARVKSLN